MQTGAIVACTSCGQKNRIGWSKLSAEGTCGACKTSLPSSARPVEIDGSESFARAIRESSIPVLVDFWAPWCGPCRTVAPELVTLAKQRAGRLLIVKVNTQAHPQLGAGHNVRSIPTMALFEGGLEVKRTSGARPAAAIAAWVDGQS